MKNVFYTMACLFMIWMMFRGISIDYKALSDGYKLAISVLNDSSLSKSLICLAIPAFAASICILAMKAKERFK